MHNSSPHETGRDENPAWPPSLDSAPNAMGHNDLSSGHLLDSIDHDMELCVDPHEERQCALSGPPDDRAQFTLDVPIAFDGYRNANSYIEALLARSRITNRPGGLWIIGEGGCGKTFILERLLKRLKPREDRFRRYCPVLYLHFAARPSEGEIYTRLLLQLGQDPRSLRSMSILELKSTLKSAIKTAGVLLIAFDESQHIWLMTKGRSTSTAGGTIGSAIKLMYDDLGVGFVFLGTTQLDEIRQTDSQTTRWPGVVHLRPFSYDDQFLSLLATLDECLPMPEQANLANPEISLKIHQSCRGNFRLLKMLLAEAVRAASQVSAAYITLPHLAMAHFLVHCAEETPFG